jgi:Chromate transport protein ChrA
MTTQAQPSILKLFTSFLRLGLTAFGGPAMVSYIRKMAVEDKHWVDKENFANGVALCQIIPGATAMQTAAYVGLKSRGLKGAAATYIGFGFSGISSNDNSGCSLQVGYQLSGHWFCVSAV